MATATKTTKTKKKTWKSQDFITAYMEYVLEHGKEPTSIYKFCKDLKVAESVFYDSFGSFKALREHIWVAFYDHTIQVLENNKEYDLYQNKEKMLSFFYTFFEMLTANRSYVLYTLNAHESSLKHLYQLKGLRTKVKTFASELIEDGNDEKSYKIAKNPVQLFSEGAWVQTLFLLRYWINDTSAGFEKTDLAIEKSVKAIFDVFETTPLESILDFGKFLAKEHFAFGKK